MYKSLAGSYAFGQYTLHIDHVQGDPFASPSRLRLEAAREKHGFPEEFYGQRHRKTALEDQILRRFSRRLCHMEESVQGSGKSGRISTCRPEQNVLPRLAVECKEDSLQIRFEMGFPARGRTILAAEMEKLVFDILPDLAEKTLFYDAWSRKDREGLQEAIDLADDQKRIREYLRENHLVSFVADGAILPRISGVSDRPMKDAVPFSSPESMRISIDLPHRGRITGMGIPEGITVIVGGGYHGKSTLLNALEKGVYDHIAGDGREFVITRDDAVKVRAEDGRSVRKTDISLFIDQLPGGQDTSTFSTENASGSTSQAANVIEALEVGAGVLMMDEDTSATNFMIRDQVMARLVPDEKEPISTLLRSIRALSGRRGISFLIVVGSSGDYLAVADHVLMLDHYMVKDVTDKAREICRQTGMRDPSAPGRIDGIRLERRIQPVSFGRMKLKAAGRDSVILNRNVIDVRYLEQLAEDGQTIGLAYLTAWILADRNNEETLQCKIDRLYDMINQKGLAQVVPQGYPCGQPVLPRKQEVYACVCRYRGR